MLVTLKEDFNSVERILLWAVDFQSLKTACYLYAVQLCYVSVCAVCVCALGVLIRYGHCLLSQPRVCSPPLCDCNSISFQSSFKSRPSPFSNFLARDHVIRISPGYASYIIWISLLTLDHKINSMNSLSYGCRA